MQQHMIACFLSNIFAKYYKNPSMLSRVIAKNVGDVFFETQCTNILRTIFQVYLDQFFCQLNGLEYIFTRSVTLQMSNQKPPVLFQRVANVVFHFLAMYQSKNTAKMTHKIIKLYLTHVYTRLCKVSHLIIEHSFWCQLAYTVHVR